MKHIIVSFLTGAAFLLAAAAPSRAEGPTLLTMIAEWQYPGSAMHGASMSDGETVNAVGERTVPSVKCQTVLTTLDPVAKVLAYYKAKLTINPEAAKAAEKTDTGRSVIFQDDAKDRALDLQVIVVNAAGTSTTLVISRGKDEAVTHIAWTHYSSRL